MKTIKLIILGFTLLTILSCNYQQNKTTKDQSVVKRPLSENKLNKKTDKIVIKDSIPCKYIVEKILTTSPRYLNLTKGLTKAVIKNGGSAFGISLEGSPNPKQDKAMSYSRTYDFTLYETYPDRQLNTTRFTFNPKNKQLYEYDVINSQLLPIEFDKSLLLKYDKNCNCFQKTSSLFIIKKPTSD